jgi:hypothetical protein
VTDSCLHCNGAYYALQCQQMAAAMQYLEKFRDPSAAVPVSHDLNSSRNKGLGIRSRAKRYFGSPERVLWSGVKREVPPMSR